MTKDELHKAVDDVIEDCLRNDSVFGDYAHNVTDAVWPVLEAAEKERKALRAELNEIRYGVAVAHDTIKALRAKLEAAEKERDEFKRACFGHISDNSMLRAKIAEMERQEPVGTLHDDGCFVWRETAPHQSNYAGWKMALYALPGAQPAPSVPPRIEPNGMYDGNHHYASGWNDCREEMLAAAPKPEGE